MSRGRGRGRGRGGGASSVTQELIRDNMDDLGLDAFAPIEARCPPPLYPTLEYTPPPSGPSANDLFGIDRVKIATNKYVLTCPLSLTSYFDAYLISTARALHV